MSKWWLVTWTTFGTWLPGDPRGFQTWRGRQYVPPPKRYAKAGEPTYDSAQFSDEHKRASAIAGEAVYLSSAQQELVRDAVIDEIASIPIIAAILAIKKAHVHLLAKFGPFDIRATVGRLKAAATRLLGEQGFEDKRVWSRNCHMKSKTTAREIRGAFDYIRKHGKNGALIHIWQGFPDKFAANFDI
ncbi:MAG: hypothetical protein WD648_13075 [Planctomycetaceae bacterium]